MFVGVNPNPTIFNGKKIMVKVVIDMIKKINPSILTVTGHPRTPRDQGSIERANKTVKRILSDVCAERRKEGLDDNWTNLLGRLTSNLNSFHGRQTNSVLAYKAIFGIDYHLQTTCSVEDAHLCNTIDELKEVIDDNGHLEHFLSDLHGYNEDDHQLGELPSVNDIGLIRKGLLYWDSKSLSDNNEDVNLVCNYDDLFDMGDEERVNLGELSMNPTTNENMTES